MKLIIENKAIRIRRALGANRGPDGVIDAQGIGREELPPSPIIENAENDLNLDCEYGLTNFQRTYYTISITDLCLQMRVSL